MTFIFKEISANSPFLSQVKELYEAAFPPDERRDFAFVEQLLNTSPHFSIRVATDSLTGEFAAFLSYWNFTSFSYIEHLAVMPQIRGVGIGHKIMADFFVNVSHRMVLEVEPPIDTITRKRVAFYESLGMTLWSDFPYTQP
ncbi:MAG: GNAT family N-acetyltransferase, partial [Muribaculaceae bacterium]